MAQVKTKYLKNLAVTTAKVADDAITDAKAKLRNDFYLRARNAADSADVNVLKVNASNAIEFASFPEKSGNPTSANQLVNKSYVDGVAEGKKWKDPVRAVATSNITLSGAQTIDGVSIIAGDRVLVAGQTLGEENGIYVAAAGAWSRAADLDASSEALNAAMFVSEGTTYADTQWVCNTDAPITLGTTPLTFVQTSGAGSITAGNGLTKTGNTLDVGAGNGISVAADSVAVNHDGEGLTFSGGALALELDGSTLSKSSSGVKVADAGITGTQLAASVAGNGLAGGAGSPLSVNVDGEGLEIVADAVALELDGATLSKSASGLKVADAGITGTQLAASVAGNGLAGGAGSALSVNVDNDTLKIVSDQVRGLKTKRDQVTLSAGDVTNQYTDLSFAAHSADSISVIPKDGIPQTFGTDFTVSLNGGSGGVTRISWAGDIATGGDAAWVAGDVIDFIYQYHY